MRRGRLACHLFALLLVSTTRAPLKLTSNFGQGHEMPSDHRGDEDNISPPISWTGVPKNTESFVFLMDSTTDGSKSGGSKAKTHWLVYDIPKEVKELREELSGAGASDVARLGMKDDAGQAPVVRLDAQARARDTIGRLVTNCQPPPGGRPHGKH